MPAVRDRVVQAAVKLVIEPVLEADFRECSYGFRPKRGAREAIAEIQAWVTWGYRKVIDADLKACFDSRSEEHTSELQSHSDLVCRLLLEKKNAEGHGV